MMKWIFDNKVSMFCVLLISIIVIGIITGVYFYFSSKHDKAILMTQEQIKKSDELQKQLSISEGSANRLKEEIEKINNKPPYITYTIQAPTIGKAAAMEQERIIQGTSPANKIPADKTIVTPNIEEYKVDVYRINLDKAKWGYNIVYMSRGNNNRAQIGIGPSWKNRDNAINMGITTEKSIYFMWTHYH